MSDHKVISTNRKARFNYDLEDSLEAGLVLTGSEIKSIRDHKVNLVDGYVIEQGGELWLMNVNISTYDQANIFNHEPLRPRKLLLHRQEIIRMISRIRERGYSVVPTQLYLKNGRAKVEIALARGKKLHDKRDRISERDVKRDIDRALKERSQE